MSKLANNLFSDKQICMQSVSCLLSAVWGGERCGTSFQGQRVGVLVVQLCPTLCDPMDLCSLPGSSVHGILQARILESVAISFSGGSSQPSDQTQISPAL